jgi:hypothetical protein
MLLKPDGEPFNAAEKGRRQPPLGFGGSCHRQQPLVAKKRDPAIGPWVGLRQRPDQRVALIAEAPARRRMQPRNQLRGMALDLRCNAATVMVDVVHDEEVWLSHMHDRHWQV